jgi:hypothetical protein
MPNLKVPLNNFQFGEISPSLTSRTDTPLYNNAGEKVRNFWIRAEGGLKRRAGTEYIATLGNYSYPVMTITFDNTAQNVGGFEVGNWFRLKTADGTLYQFQMQAIGPNTQVRDPVPETGENGRIIYFVYGTGSGSAVTDNTAENLSNRINGIGNNTGVSNTLTSSDKVSPFTATFSGSTVTITRNETSHDNLEVETSNSGAFQVTDFRVLRMSHRLEPFIFSDDEKYLICFSHETIRAYLIDNDTGKPLIDAAGASYGGDDALHTITGQTWLQNTLDKQYIPEITFAQQGDIMFIAHNTFMIRQLVRTSLTTFAVETFNFAESLNQNKIYQPYFSFQSTDARIQFTNNNTIGRNKPVSIFRYTPDGPVSTESIYYFKCPATPATHDTLINQVVAGKVYAIIHAQSSSIADFQAIGAPYNDVGLVFQATEDGSGINNFSSTTGQLALLGDISVAPQLGTNIKIKNARVTIEALDNCTQGQCNQNGFSSRARVKNYEKIEAKLPVDSLSTDEGSSVITVTQALHGFTDGSITIANAGAVGGIPASDINGTQVITVVDDNTYTFDTGGGNATSSAIGGGTPTVGDGNIVVTHDWAEQSYSAYYGYPAAITFHQNRLWFGGTLGQPDSIWASKSGDFFNFDIGDAEDNDAIDITTSVGEINQIRHLVSNRDLQVFTAGSELYVQAPTTKPITPSNAQIIKQTPFGSTFVKPQAFDGATLFMQNTGNALREFLFTDAEDAYTSVAVSSLAPHLIRNPTQQTIIKGTLDRSENYSFLVNEDGTIAVFYSVRGDKKAGWSLWDTNGMWHSLCSVRENLYAISMRNGRVALEMFNQSIPLDHARFFSLEDGSNAPTVLGGFSDMITYGIGGAGLVGSQARTYKTGSFHAVDGNNYLGVFDPNGTGTLGQPTLDLSSTKADLRKILLGDAFYTELKTLPIDAQLANGPLTGEPREVSRIIADFNNTLSANVKAPDASSTARDLTITTSTTYPNNAIPFTGKKEFRTLGYSQNPRVIISQGQPMDLQINGIVVEVAY